MNMVHTLVISVLGIQIKVDLWGFLARQASLFKNSWPLRDTLPKKSWMVPEKKPKVFFCSPYGEHTHTTYTVERGTNI